LHSELAVAGAPKKESDHLKGSVNGGGKTVWLRTSAGSIHVKKWNATELEFEMLKAVAALALALGVEAADPVPLCLPKVHTVHLSQFRDVEHEQRHRPPDERMAGDELQIFFDMTQQKSLVYIHDDGPSSGPHRRDPDRAMLTDYAKQLQWNWEWVNKTVQRCTLEVQTRQMAPICISAKANMTGTGTISEDFKVDFYAENVVDPTRQVNEMVFTIVEQGTTTKPIKQDRRGQQIQPDRSVVQWFDRVTFYNMVETPIDPKQFAIPSECPA